MVIPTPRLPLAMGEEVKRPAAADERVMNVGPGVDDREQ
jgi:hypothetical protein